MRRTEQPRAPAASGSAPADAWEGRQEQSRPRQDSPPWQFWPLGFIACSDRSWGEHILKVVRRRTGEPSTSEG